MEYTKVFCKDCTYNDPRNQRCGHPTSIRYVDPVSGSTMYESNVYMRANEGMCAYEGKYFSLSEKPKTFIQRLLKK